LDHVHLWVIRRMRLGDSAETTTVTLVRESKIQDLAQRLLTDPDVDSHIRRMTFPELFLSYELTGRRSTLRYLI
jgi:hypothetical protein